MPRYARNTLSSNYIHLIVQGINKEYIFRQKEWKEEFIKILESKIGEFSIQILAYCIMDNHAHFLVYSTEKQEISCLMKKVNTIYAMKYNKINKRKGYVFRDRFFTQPILSQRQLYNCLVYIHRNPVEAGICMNIQDYFYSSYNEFTKQKRLISENSIKLLFGSESLEEFYAIHDKIQEIKDIKDVIDKEYNIEELIKKYRENYNEKLEDNEIAFGNLLLEIRQKCGISLREMATIFNINKDKLNKYIHKVIENG